jgi:asparagine synthetase B (glutamine-hydrolysing)
MNLNYPSIFGYRTLNNSLEDFQPIESVITLFRDVRNMGLFMTGESKEIHLFRDKKQIFILFGRVYSPVALNPFIKNTEDVMHHLISIDLKDIQGNFTLIKIYLDKSVTKLSLSTDKYGFRRILYYKKNDIVYFATHLKGLSILLKNKWPNISSESLLHYYNFGFTQNNNTIFEGIKKVPPGSSLIVEKGEISIKPYFSLASLYHPKDYLRRSENEIAKTIDSLLLESIQRRVISNETVGVALSGGVDSGYIAEKLVQNNSHIIGYNIAYSGYYDELERVNYIAKALNIDMRKIIVTPEQVIKNFEYANSLSSEPMGFNNATMRFVVLEAQKDGVDLLFDGDGTDRLFLGMDRYLQLHKAIRIYLGLKKAGILPIVKKVLRFIMADEFKKLYIHFENWDRGIYPYPERNLDGMKDYDEVYEWKVYELAVKQFRDRYEQDIGASDFGLYFTYQAIQMCPEMFFYDPSEIQSELSLHSIHAYWTDSLVSLALSIPTKWKLRRKQTKYILRKAATTNLDSKYWMLPKIGLQNSFAYIAQSEEGSVWRNRQRGKVIDSFEYKILQEIIPVGNIQTDRLIGLIVWKEKNTIL